MRFPAVLLLALMACGPPKPEDIGPEGENGPLVDGVAQTGLISALAATRDYVYAVSLNAGVWRLSQAGSTAWDQPLGARLRQPPSGRWEQLLDSPPLATSIAVDPTNGAHIVVGERNGEAKPARFNHGGVWESADSGNTWSLAWNPMWEAGCRALDSAAVPDVLFDGLGNLYVASPCGVFRRPVGSAPTEFVSDATTPTLGSITALSRSRPAPGLERIWARTSRDIAFSDTQGAQWTSVVIPALTGELGTTTPSRGDIHSIAGFGTSAAILVVPNRVTSTQAAIQSIECNPAVPGQNQKNTLLYFRQATGDFVVQTIPDSCDGAGTGGRRFLRSIVTTPAAPTPLGSGTRVYLSSAQDLYEASGMAPNQTFTWTKLTTAGTHADFWDVAVTPLDSLPGGGLDLGGALTLATDGGVFRLTMPFWVAFGPWQQLNRGLHTHHIHSLVALPTGSSAEPVARLLYATSDNGAWERDAAPATSPMKEWRLSAGGCEGDSNFAFGDVGNWGIAATFRHGACGHWTNFTNTRTLVNPLCEPVLDAQGLAVCSGGPTGPAEFSFIQTLENESPRLGLDAVRLAALPLSFISAGAIEPAPGALSSLRGPAIIRNQGWLTAADSAQGWSGWEVVDTALPVLPKRRMHAVLVSGGHASPTYFGILGNKERPELWRKGPGGWARVDVGAPLLAIGSTHGPVFVNPFDPDHIFALTTGGVRVTSTGSGFVTDEALTALVTASGKFPFAAAVDTNDFGAVMASRANPLAVISQIAFNRRNPHEVVVGAPFTGAFYAADDSRLWRKLSHEMPLMRAQVSAVALDGFRAYVATEGRGILALREPGRARVATYFVRSADAAAGVIASLVAASGKPARRTVNLIVLPSVGRETSFTVKTDEQGRVRLPQGNQPPPGTVVYLTFAGTSNLAGSETSLEF